ncbi:MAG: acetolactate synthase large subunit [Acidimicrobiia bacterium]|nr:acetolactate synthase large subunit [Acidimicrobiia bacterium]
MNGAQSLFKALVDAGIDTCFANPGTSEMQLVYEMGLTDDMRPILCLEENIVTGAADGYGRMAGKPALTLLHVGSGFANGIANLQNAGRANTPMVNVVGANATYHQYRFPEHEMVGGRVIDLARVVSHWTREARSASDLAVIGAAAARYATMGAGKICTVIAPTDCHWDPSAGTPVNEHPISSPRVSPETVQEAADRLQSGRKTVLLLGGPALRDDELEIVGRIAAKTGAQIMAETTPGRFARGAGRIHVPFVKYLLEMSLPQFREVDQVILVGALNPVATFAYQGMPLSKIPEKCALWTLATTDHDIPAALNDLAVAVGAGVETTERVRRVEPKPPAGELTVEAIGQSMSLLMPDDTILVDEAITASSQLFEETRHARRHDYLLAPSGGAIGNGLPLALGAAVACPDRKVVGLQGDGSGMYTPQALWSIARENCDVTVVVLRNDDYGILNLELARVAQKGPTDKMLSMLKLDRPSIDWVGLSEGIGVQAVSVATAEDFHTQFEQAMGQRGPRLIEARVSQDLQPAIDMIRSKAK